MGRASDPSNARSDCRVQTRQGCGAEDQGRGHHDDEETKVLTAITPEMMAQYKREKQLDAVLDAYFEDGEAEDKGDRGDRDEKDGDGRSEADKDTADESPAAGS